MTDRLTLRLHPGVLVRRSPWSTRITDAATGLDLCIRRDRDVPPALHEVTVAFVLLHNGLARAPRAACTETLRAFGLTGREPLAKEVLSWGTARRTVTRPGRGVLALGLIVVHCICAVFRLYGPPSALVGIGSAALFALLRAPIPTVVWSAVLPALVVVATAMHEAGHWLALRWLEDPRAGALLVGHRICAVAHRSLTGADDGTAASGRIVAAAGPTAGLATALALGAIGRTELVAVMTSAILVAVNLFGFTTWSADGRRLGPD